MATLTDLYLQATEEASEANEARYQEALDIADQISALYSSDGTYSAGYTASLEKAKSQSVASGMNSLIQSGLGATAGAASLATAWEQNVGANARLTLADTLTEKQAEALQYKASIIQSKEDTYPDYASLLQATAAGASSSGSSTGTFGGTAQFGGDGYTYGELGGDTGSSIVSNYGTSSSGTSNSDAWYQWYNELKALENTGSTSTAATTTSATTTADTTDYLADWTEEDYEWAAEMGWV